MAVEEQTQCPNCGGYRVKVNIEDVYRKTGGVVPVDFGTRFWKLIQLLVAMYFTIFTVGLAFLSEGVRGWYSRTIRIIFLGVDDEKVLVTTIHHCECIIDGYKWDWDVHDPKPEVTFRPNLIVAGVKKLEEEEEERRRRND